MNPGITRPTPEPAGPVPAMVGDGMGHLLSAHDVPYVVRGWTAAVRPAQNDHMASKCG